MIRVDFRSIGIALAIFASGTLTSETPTWKELLVPTEISTSITKESIPYADGWAPTKKEYGYGLAWVGVFVGIPDWEWYDLHSEGETKVGRYLVTEWDLEWAPKNKKLWIVCGYHYTQAELRLQLPKGVKKVRVTCDAGNKVNGYPNVTKVECM